MGFRVQGSGNETRDPGPRTPNLEPRTQCKYTAERSGAAETSGMRRAVEQPVATRLAARETGVPVRALRNWIRSGKLGAMRAERGYLVRIADVRRLAVLAGRDPATGRAAKSAPAESVPAEKFM